MEKWKGGGSASRNLFEIKKWSGWVLRNWFRGMILKKRREIWASKMNRHSMRYIFSHFTANLRLFPVGRKWTASDRTAGNCKKSVDQLLAVFVFYAFLQTFIPFILPPNSNEKSKRIDRYRNRIKQEGKHFCVHFLSLHIIANFHCVLKYPIWKFKDKCRHDDTAFLNLYI